MQAEEERGESKLLWRVLEGCEGSGAGTGGTGALARAGEAYSRRTEMMLVDGIICISICYP